MANSCKDKCIQLLILTCSSIIALGFVWWFSNAMMGWVYEFDTKSMVQETIREMVKEEAIKKGH